MPLTDGKCYVIAEAGSCHMGEYEQAHNLVRAAHSCGADAVKFQLFRPEDISLRPSNVDTRTVLPPEWITDLTMVAREYRIDFLCTPFAPWAVEAVNPHVWAHKIGSFEHQRADVLDAVRKTGKPVIASEGRGRMPDWVDYRLYCISKYPTPPEDVFLNAMPRDWYDGFSDHTTSTVIPALAVAMGARIIEKHIRDVDTPESCPDYPHSLPPRDFRTMVDNIRLAELTCWRDAPDNVARADYADRRE